MTPTDQTSTLDEIFGGSLPTTKHSGGKYLYKKILIMQRDSEFSDPDFWTGQIQIQRDSLKLISK